MNAVERTLYIDCFSRVAGDMLLGALFDLGASRVAVEGELGHLPEGADKLTERDSLTARFNKTRLHTNEYRAIHSIFKIPAEQEIMYR